MTNPILKAETFNAQWLMEAEFPPIKYVIPGIIPEGLSVLVAAPKVGKSWLVLALAINLSTGTKALGHIEVGEPRPVLYLALEDGKARLQSRLRHMELSVSNLLEFSVNLNGQDPVEVIRDWIASKDGLDPIVILDTLGKVMPTATGQTTQYGHEYKVMSGLKQACDAFPGSALIIVHHTRKQDSGDFLDAVSGTQGIAGAADSILVLKRDRHNNRATLQVTSRDAVEGEYSLVFQDSGLWELDGQSLSDASKAALVAKASAGVGDRMAEVIEVVSRYPEGIKSKDIRVLLPNVSNLDEYLRRAFDAGRIEKLTRGLYAPVRNVRSVSLPDSNSHNLTVITHPHQRELLLKMESPWDEVSA